MQINKLLSRYNQTSRGGTRVKYIVIHYVGEVSTARNNCIYFSSPRTASAHYFIDSLGIWQSVDESMAAWHCGGGLQGSGGHTLHGICTNSNSIGVEMCLKKDSKGRLYVDAETIQHTADLVQDIQRRYSINPVNVIRHFDVTGKECPNCYTYYDFTGTLLEYSRWNSFRWHLCNDKRGATKPAPLPPGDPFPGRLSGEFLGRGYTVNSVYVRDWREFLAWYGYTIDTKSKHWDAQLEALTVKWRQAQGIGSAPVVDGAAYSKARRVRISRPKGDPFPGRLSGVVLGRGAVTYSAYVGDWQRFLRWYGYTIDINNTWDQLTEALTVKWRIAHGIGANPVVDAAAYAKAREIRIDRKK